MSFRILVVEDNAANSELLCDWLDLNGYDALSVNDLGGAYATLQSARFDAVLLDIQLGLEDGAELAVWLRKQGQHLQIPVIAVTAHALPAEQKRIIQAGCSAYVSKPIDFENLARMLQRCLAKRTQDTSRVPNFPQYSNENS